MFQPGAYPNYALTTARSNTSPEKPDLGGKPTKKSHIA